MPKEKSSKTRPKGQKSIESFFGAKNHPQHDEEEIEPTTDAQTEAEATLDEPEDNSSDIEMEQPVGGSKKLLKQAAPDASDLPPIHEIPAIFDDLVSRIPGIKEVAEHVNGRRLRVATMCSGTESPLLALELIQKALQDQHSINLEIDHVFSCEIEPFKQAYIERNFQPPLLFRDVCELGDEAAHTAYGALAAVPGDVDMLIAGTSCVDYSNLNTQKQDIDANGESGRTFRGMMSWVTNHRPPIVILENVCSAPWDRVQQYFEKNGYSACFSRVDTKNYYIPHTRTRVYLIAVNKKNSHIPEQWKDTVINKLKRPASSTLDAFLLASDDPRIHHARQKLVQESFNAREKRSGRTDWSRCESRHQRARLEEELGAKRPLTSWEEGGYCKLPDFAWNDWGVGQVERVWDLMDISLLRAAGKGVDPSYKTTVWNLSQNVDRTIGSNKVGICPCLTPSMIPYITNRGGPMVGLEALSMQGLPVDKLLLTRESEDQLADLAGNAMSSTVVGACILAALVCSKRLLKAGSDRETYEMKDGNDQGDGEDAMDVDKPMPLPSRTQIIGEERLTIKPLDLSATNERALPDLLEQATQSSRLCVCEGRTGMTTRELSRCKDCGSTFCKRCGGRPEHNTEPCNDTRVHPSEFAREIKSILPMSIELVGIDEPLLASLRETRGQDIKDGRWSSWRDAVLRTTKSELHFMELKRQEIWSAIYQSPTAVLELSLHPKLPEWRLFALPEQHDPANAEIRQILQYPVARMLCKDGLLSSHWEFALPVTTNFSVTVEGSGELVPSWEARLGLIGASFKDQTVFSKIKIKVPDDHVGILDRDISGEYVLLDKCGTANGALHKKIPSATESNLPPLFMLFDPHRTNDSEDCFVFSTSIRRLEYRETRPIVCKLDPSWRQSSKEGKQNVECHLPFRWVLTQSSGLKAAGVTDATFGVASNSLDIPLTKDACQSAYALLKCSVALGDQAGPEWPRGVWRQVDKVHERSVFKSLAWLLERIRRVDDNVQSWQEVQLSDEFECKCERCAPTAPALRWASRNNKMQPIEDPVQAGEYERRLKLRPSPFVTELKLDDNGNGTVRIGTNIPSLLHRALSRLPTKNRSGKAKLTWRLDTDFSPVVGLSLPKFVILSNKNDKEHAQPPNFKIPLRKEQLRSLEWMLRQESLNADPFIEEEISEAILDPLGWRAEGRAQRPVRVRGGVLADQVGYGKTAITLGLIDCAAKSVNSEFDKIGRLPGKINTKATLVVVPPHLTRQWKSEVEKFIKKKCKVIVYSSVAALNATSIEDIQEADVLVVAASIFKSGVYLENLSLLAGVGDLPAGEGRHFNTHLESALEALRGQVDRLQDEGSGAVLAEIKEAQLRVAAEEARAAAAVASKRLKGKSYREAAEKSEKTQKEKPSNGTNEAMSKKPEQLSRAPGQKATPTPSGLVPEVVITVPPPVRSAGSTSRKSGASVSSEPAGDSDDSTTRKPSRRAAAKRVVLASDSDDSEEEEIPKSKAKAPARKKPGKATKPSGKRKRSKATSDESDYMASSAEESGSDVESINEDDLSDASLKPQTKAKAKKPGKKVNGKSKPQKKHSVPPTSASEPGTEDEDMDVDKPVKPIKPKKQPRKRKAEDDAERPAKKAKRADIDPWKLGSRAVKDDWTQMKAPPFEMFNFARIVVDEYTYLDGKIHSLVTNLKAERHWVLSGTPPIHDFAAVKTIAAFLHIHLGVDDDGEGQSVEVKKRRRDQTNAERFHSFREVHSLEWHAHRHTVGQAFLDAFVRQNIAEIDEIPWTEKIEEITLPAAERAIYLELEHHLRALDMTIKRGRKTESDREKRLNQSLGESKSAEEALLKRCSHFDLETSNENAMKACDVIVQGRRKQLDECRNELLTAIKAGVVREKKLGNVGNESMFNEYVRICRTEGVDDEEATTLVNELLDEAGLGTPKSKPKAQDVQLSEKLKEKVWEHREKTHEIRRLTKELTGRIRSLRYFTVVRDIQKQKEKRKPVECPSCGTKEVPLSNVAVLSSCGHEGCVQCVIQCAEKEECVYAASGKCKSAARVLNVVKADTLGVDDETRDSRGKHFGRKLEQVVDLIKKRIPKGNRILLFVQFPDLMKKVTEALSYNKIGFLEIKGSAHQKSKNLELFQEGSAERVLLLNVMDESASGANLTSANHAIFLSPLLAPSNEIYTACETQAIGRLVRYGQDQHVYVWRFLTLNTIDQEIYEKRKQALVHS